jgi:hypothetical protein
MTFTENPVRYTGSMDNTVAFDLNLTTNAVLSRAIIERGAMTFADACNYIRALPYKRNTDKDDVLCVLNEGGGTCSTKHALLKRIADENGITVSLVIGIIRMDSSTSPAIAQILKQHTLDFIPEAHCYLKHKGHIVDCTGGSLNPRPVILTETQIEPGQISDFKVAYHKAYIENWVSDTNFTTYTTDELWLIRESCIKALS